MALVSPNCIYVSLIIESVSHFQAPLETLERFICPAYSMLVFPHVENMRKTGGFFLAWEADSWKTKLYTSLAAISPTKSGRSFLFGKGPAEHCAVFIFSCTVCSVQVEKSKTQLCLYPDPSCRGVAVAESASWLQVPLAAIRDSPEGEVQEQFRNYRPDHRAIIKLSSVNKTGFSFH